MVISVPELCEIQSNSQNAKARSRKPESYTQDWRIRVCGLSGSAKCDHSERRAEDQAMGLLWLPESAQCPYSGS